jgi:adenylate cyclase
LDSEKVNATEPAACFYAELDEKQTAIENLSKALENGFGNYEYIKHDPDLDSIRNEPKYIELMKGK